MDVLQECLHYRLRLPDRPQVTMTSMPDKPDEEKPVTSFESCLDELEKVVKELESGDLPLERSLELFEKGVALSETCRKQLEAAETRVEMLLRKDGKIQAEPFPPDKQ
jgi:exodeoxyribonuclease VII small subunit